MPKSFRTEQGFKFTAPNSWRGVSIETYLDIIDPANEGKGSGWFISVLSGVPLATLRKQKVGFNFATFVLEHLPFTVSSPEVWTERPGQILVGNEVEIKLPDDLGSVSTFGQMCDVELFLQSEKQAVGQMLPFRVTRTILSVFLWDMFETEPYIDRQTAEVRVWEKVKYLNCVDALSLVSFFLTNILQPADTGLIYLETIQEPKKKRWQQVLRRVMNPFRTILRRCRLRLFSVSRSTR